MGLNGGQMACTMLFGTMILTYLGLEASRLRVLLRVGGSFHVCSLVGERWRMGHTSLC